MISSSYYFHQIVQETFTDASKCSQAQLLSTPNYDLFGVFPKEKSTEQIKSDKMMIDFTLPWEITDDKVNTALMDFMVWASLTRDMEMQTGK